MDLLTDDPRVVSKHLACCFADKPIVQAMINAMNRIAELESIIKVDVSRGTISTGCIKVARPPADTR